MMNSIQDSGNGSVLFDIFNDRKGVKVVVQKNEKILRETYVLNFDEALVIRGHYINQHWNYRLN